MPANRRPATVQTHQKAEADAAGPISLPISFFSAGGIAPDWDAVDRDRFLRGFWKDFGNDMLSAVLAVSVAKVETQNWEIEGPEAIVGAYQRILRDEANFHRGWGDLVARGVQDYYTQDNGWFMERQRSGASDYSGPMLGVAHLDSARMRPTGNENFPYIYTDIHGTDHLMHRSQYIRIVDMPTPQTDFKSQDKGFCALSRALSTAIILTLLVTMKRERLSDLPPSAIAVFNNINRNQFETAMKLYNAEEDMKSNVIWRQLMPLFGIDPSQPAGIQFVSLREVWDGFDDMTAMNVAAYSFAAAWRIDPREFWPVSQGPLGTGKEAEVQHQKAKAKSTGLLFTSIERAFNSSLSLPDSASFRFALQDADEEQQRAHIHGLQVSNVKAMQEAGAGLTAEEIRWLLAVQYRVLPRDMLTVPEEGAEPIASDVYLDDVERQSKAFGGWWMGPMVRVDSQGRKVYLSKREKRLYMLPAPTWIGEKGGAGSGNWGHAGRPGLVGGSGGRGGMLNVPGDYGPTDAKRAADFVLHHKPGDEPDARAKSLLDDLVLGDQTLGEWAADTVRVIRSQELVDSTDFLTSDDLETLRGFDGPGVWGHDRVVRVVPESRMPELDRTSLEAEYGISKHAVFPDVKPTGHWEFKGGRFVILISDASSNKRATFWHEFEHTAPGADVGELASRPSFKGMPSLVFGDKAVLEATIVDRMVCCESHAADLWQPILADMCVLNYLTDDKAATASMAPQDWVHDVAQAMRPLALSGGDVLTALAYEIERRLPPDGFALDAKAGKGLKTINQKIAALPRPLARQVRETAAKINATMSESRKRRLGLLRDIPDTVWDEAVAADELEAQPTLEA